MESKELAEYLDQQRWLINNGLITDALKNQLFFCGSIVHGEVQALSLQLIPEKKTVDYKIYVPTTLLKKVNKYQKLSTNKSLLGLWRFKRFLKKEGDLDFTGILNKFIKDYCGVKWVANVQIIDHADYVPGDEGGDAEDGWVFNQFPDPK